MGCRDYCITSCLSTRSNRSLDAKGFNPQNWVNQLLAVFREFNNTQFYWVDPKHNIGSSTDNIEIRYLTKSELCDTLRIQSHILT